MVRVCYNTQVLMFLSASALEYALMKISNLNAPISWEVPHIERAKYKYFIRSPFLQCLDICTELVGFLALQGTPCAYLFAYPVCVLGDIRYCMSFRCLDDVSKGC